MAEAAGRNGQVRMIATDMDGTLLAADGHVSARTIEVLRRAHAAGIVVVAATGRSHRTAGPRLAPLGIVDWAVCSNGAVLYSLADDLVVEHHPITPVAARAMVTTIAAAVPEASFAWETLDGFVYEEGFRTAAPSLDPLTNRWPTVPRAGYAAARAAIGELTKLMVGHPGLAHEQLLTLVSPLLPDDVVPSSSGARFVEITGDGVDKAFGLARLCARLGIAADEVVAFGDHLNDLAMIQWSGHGVAMGNAHPDLVAAADAQAGHHDDDGLAEFVEQLLDRATG